MRVDGVLEVCQCDSSLEVDRRSAAESRTILMPCFHGWAIRNALYSGLLRELGCRGNVFVLTTSALLPDAGTIGEYAPMAHFVALDSAPVVGSPSRLLGRIAARCLNRLHYENRVRDTRTLLAKASHGYTQAVDSSAVTTHAAKVVDRISLVRRLLQRMLDVDLVRENSTTAVEGLLHNLRVHTIYLQSTFFPQDRLFAALARCKGIRLVGSVLSWDNLSSKGPLPGEFDEYLVWGRIMRDELLSFYDYVKPRSVKITGPVQFDWHAQARWQLSREQTCSQFGLDPSRPYLLYGFGAPLQAPNEARVLRYILESCTRGRLRRMRLQVCARLHPKCSAASLDDLVISYPQLAVSQPNPTADVARWRAVPEDIANLVNLVRHAAVVLNIFSTLTLDAIIHDRPVINIAWSPGEPKPWPGTLGQYYTHFQPVIELGASPVASDGREIEEYVVRYIQDPSLHRANREALCARMCHARDGMAHQRIAQILFPQTR
jgi:hypothetical protein